jgi:hypothetical protein
VRALLGSANTCTVKPEQNALRGRAEPSSGSNRCARYREESTGWRQAKSNVCDEKAQH